MKPFTNLRMNMCIDTFAIIHIYIYIYTRLCHVDVKINTIVYHSMYMCLYILYVCRPLNLSKHTKFRQYRIPVISIASTRFFKHVIFYSTMFFPHRLMTWCLYYHNFIGCPEGVWMAESAFHIQSHLPSMAHNGRRGLNAAWVAPFNGPLSI